MRRAIFTLLGLVSLAGAFVHGASAAELDLKSGGRDVPVDPVQRAALSTSLESYFLACHAYTEVVRGAELPQDRLTALWTEQARLPHAVLRTGAGPGAPEQARGSTLEILFGFSSESGPHPVLARSADGTLTSYIKCPGLPGLLLACRVHGLMPGMAPSSRCDEWAALDADGSAANDRP